MRGLALTGVIALISASVVASGISSAGAGQTTKTLHVVGAYEIVGDSPLGLPNFDDGAKLAVKDLEKQGYNVRYERIPSSATLA